MRVLNRPMFRKGGSTAQGSGISSLVQPRGMYANSNYQDLLEQIKSGQQKYVQSIRSSAEPTTAEKIVVLGRIASTPGNLYEKSKAALPAISKILEGKRQAEEKANLAELSGLTDIAKLELAGIPKPGSKQQEYQFLLNKYKEFRAAGSPAFKNKTDAELSQQAIDQISNAYRAQATVGESVRQLDLRYGADIAKLKSKLATITDQQTYDKTKAELEGIFNFYRRAGLDISQDPDFMIPEFVAPKRKKKSEGGRIGYAEGSEDVVGSEVEQIVDSTNPVQTGTPLKNFSYDELRGRLPQEVSNDIVKLLSTSQQALEDFAYITTQSDIGNFNQKYGVNLTLPVSE